MTGADTSTDPRRPGPGPGSGFAGGPAWDPRSGGVAQPRLVVTLTQRDFLVRYKQAVLGIAWAVITPVVLVTLFALLFNRVAHVDTGGAPYVIFAYLGLLPWTFFSLHVVAVGGEPPQQPPAAQQGARAPRGLPAVVAWRWPGSTR